MVLGLVARDREVDDKVGRVASRGQHAPALRRPVDWAEVVWKFRSFVVGGGLEPKDGHVGEQNLRVALHQRHMFVRPLGALEEHAVAVRAVLGLHREVVARRHCFKVKHHGVNRELVLPGVVLEHAGEERVGEEEPGDPKHGRRALVDPLLERLQPSDQLAYVRSQWLEARVRLLGPHRGNLPVEHGVAERVQLPSHDDLALQRQLEGADARVDHLQQPVIPDELLAQHGVHGLVVLHGVLVIGNLEVKDGRYGLRNLRGELTKRLLLALTPAARGVTLREQDGVAHQIGLLLVLGDVRVGVEPESFGIRRDWHLLEKVNVGRVVTLHGRAVAPGG